MYVCNINIKYYNHESRFFNSNDFLGSKTKESKIRKLSISKSKIMTISVDNLNWMGVTDAVVIGLEEGKIFEGVENTVFYLAASDVEDERSFKVNNLGVKYKRIYLKDLLDYLGWDIGENSYAVYDIIKEDSNLFRLQLRVIKRVGVKMMNDIDIKNKRILLFDFDGTLIETASGNTFATDLTDMRIKMDVVNKALDLMQENGVKVFAIVSNQGGVEAGFVSGADIEAKIEYVLRSVHDLAVKRGIRGVLYEKGCVIQMTNKIR